MTKHARDDADAATGEGETADAASLPGKLEQVIATQVRRYRTSHGLSSAELAARTGLSKAMISRIETATTSCSLTTLQRLADGLKIPVTALFRGADTDRDATFTKSGE
ncbi:MAG: helix-turn-helix transcriptional regulator, partial [Cellulosimicrobium cellulans]